MVSRVGRLCPGLSWVLWFAAPGPRAGAFEVEGGCPRHAAPLALRFWRVCGYRLLMECYRAQPLIWSSLFVCLGLQGRVYSANPDLGHVA